MGCLISTPKRPRWPSGLMVPSINGRITDLGRISGIAAGSWISGMNCGTVDICWPSTGICGQTIGLLSRFIERIRTKPMESAPLGCRIIEKGIASSAIQPSSVLRTLAFQSPAHVMLPAVPPSSASTCVPLAFTENVDIPRWRCWLSTRTVTWSSPQTAWLPRCVSLLRCFSGSLSWQWKATNNVLPSVVTQASVCSTTGASPVKRSNDLIRRAFRHAGSSKRPSMAGATSAIGSLMFGRVQASGATGDACVPDAFPRMSIAQSVA